MADDYVPVEAPDPTQALGAMIVDTVWGSSWAGWGWQLLGGSGTPATDWWLRTDNPSETWAGTGLDVVGGVTEAAGKGAQAANQVLPKPWDLKPVLYGAAALGGLWLAVRLVGR